MAPPSNPPPPTPRPARPALPRRSGAGAVDPRTAVYRRRRVVGPCILAVALVVVAMAGIPAVLRPLPGSVDGRPLGPAERPGCPPAPARSVVQPGETLWASPVASSPRATCAPWSTELVALNGGDRSRSGRPARLPG